MTGDKQLQLKDEVYQVTGCAMEVLNALGHGLHEKPYENALIVEMGLKNIPCAQQCRYPVIYKSVQVGEYIPDLIAYSSLIVEAKTVEKLGDNEIAQVLNYLNITGLKVGLLLNFKHAQLEWKRVVL